MKAILEFNLSDPDDAEAHRADLIWTEHIHKKTLDGNLMEKGLDRMWDT